jgi:hypothetical protein
MEPPDESRPTRKDFGVITTPEPTPQEKQIEELQEQLAHERDARKEDRFVFIVAGVLLFDVVFFSLMPTFGGPIALLLLQLLILIPLARRMGMEEIARILSRVLDRMADRS